MIIDACAYLFQPLIVFPAGNCYSSLCRRRQHPGKINASRRSYTDPFQPCRCKDSAVPVAFCQLFQPCIYVPPEIFHPVMRVAVQPLRPPADAARGNGKRSAITTMVKRRKRIFPVAPEYQYIRIRISFQHRSGDEPFCRLCGHILERMYCYVNAVLQERDIKRFGKNTLNADLV